MNLSLNRITEKIGQNSFIKNFIKELGEALERMNNNEVKGEKMENLKLTREEDFDFYKKESNFLHEYFKKELSNSSKGEVFIVTDKYENDNEFHRYKIAQYKNNLEYKYVTFEKDLPRNVQIGDVIRKVNGKYIYDKEATEYINDAKNKIKQNIIKNRNQD